MSEGHKTNENIERWKIEKLIKSLENANSKYTSLVSIITPPQYEISLLQKTLYKKLTVGVETMNKVIEQSIASALRILERRSSPLKNGLVLYTGIVVANDRTTMVTIDFEPFKPIVDLFYCLDNKFHLKHLKELLKQDIYGFVVMNGERALFGRVRGNTMEVFENRSWVFRKFLLMMLENCSRVIKPRIGMLQKIFSMAFDIRDELHRIQDHVFYYGHSLKYLSFLKCMFGNMDDFKELRLEDTSQDDLFENPLTVVRRHLKEELDDMGDFEEGALEGLLQDLERILMEDDVYMNCRKHAVDRLLRGYIFILKKYLREDLSEEPLSHIEELLGSIDDSQKHILDDLMQFDGNLLMMEVDISYDYNFVLDHFISVIQQHLRKILGEDLWNRIYIMSSSVLHKDLWKEAKPIAMEEKVDLKNRKKRAVNDLLLGFARTQMEHSHVRKMARLAEQRFINPANRQDKVSGLILAGSLEFTTKLSDMFDRGIVLNMVEVSTGGMLGFNEAIEKSAEVLCNVKFIQVNRLIHRFFEEISQETCKWVCGVDDTLKALEKGNVEILIVWEGLDVYRYTLKNAATGEIIIKHLKEGDEADQNSFRDAELEVQEKMPLVDWFAENYKTFECTTEFVTDKGQMGSQFCKGFSGIGGILRIPEPDIPSSADPSDDEGGIHDDEVEIYDFFGYNDDDSE